MASYFELLKHPKWQKRRLEILSQNGFECSNCGSTKKTLHVHHCYYEKGKKPWEYPDSALRCLCVDCHQSAEAAKLALEKVLSEIWEDDAVYGYALGAYAFHNLGSDDRRLIDIPSYEVAEGIADYWGLNLERVVLPDLMSNNGRMSAERLAALVREHGAPTKPWLQRLCDKRP